jgi:ribosomal protein S16
MRKLPTTSEIPAKTSRNVVMKEIASRRSPPASSAARAGHRLEARRQRGGDGVAQLGLADPVLGGDPHVGVDVTAVEEQLLGGALLEDRHRRSVERATLREVRDADERRPQDRLGSGGHEVHLLTELVPGGLGGPPVQRHLAGTVGLLTRDDLQPFDPVPGGCVVKVAAEAGGALPADDLAVLPDDVDPERRDVAVGTGGALDLREVVDDRGRNGA